MSLSWFLLPPAFWFQNFVDWTLQQSLCPIGREYLIKKILFIFPSNVLFSFVRHTLLCFVFLYAISESWIVLKMIIPSCFLYSWLGVSIVCTLSEQNFIDPSHPVKFVYDYLHPLSTGEYHTCCIETWVMQYYCQLYKIKGQLKSYRSKRRFQN